jgi:hypothetical protein
MRELMANKNIYLEFICDHVIGKKSSPQNVQFFLFFTNFEDFQLKLWDRYLPKGTTVMANFLPQIQLFKLYKIGHLSVDSKTLVVFLWETPWNRPTGIIRFFGITHEGVDQSFSSSNSTGISIRRFYAQNYRVNGRTYWPILECIPMWWKSWQNRRFNRDLRPD